MSILESAGLKITEIFSCESELHLASLVLLEVPRLYKVLIMLVCAHISWNLPRFHKLPDCFYLDSQDFGKKQPVIVVSQAH